MALTREVNELLKPIYVHSVFCTAL